MADIYCAKCGEPWDAYGVRHGGDMTTSEAHRFLRGEGCPSCHFGTKCPACKGTGKERCTCLDGKVIVKHGYYERYEDVYDYELGRYVSVGRNYHPPKFEECRTCKGKGFLENPCPVCRGTGKPVNGPEMALRALESEAEASDEDPIVIMHRRGF